ncbi:hypothetical protein [Hwanghaeella sp.]|uniref:hypothetical protein n=1 Tax=Hwanghaeella sp. TaxID=2605943 RepID=UPI003CCBEF5E
MAILFLLTPTTSQAQAQTVFQTEVSEAPQGTLLAVADNGSKIDELVWARIKNEQNASVLREYIARFPDGKYVAEAEKRAGKLEANQELSRTVRAANTTGRFGLKTFTANLTGANPSDWGGAYRSFCSPDSSYRVSIKRDRGKWKAELLQAGADDRLSFNQLAPQPEEEAILLFGYLVSGTSQTEHQKSAVEFVPKSGGLIRLSVPGSTTGDCAVGYLE